MAEQKMISAFSASSNSSSTVSSKRYDVFLSFRGEDTRKNFTSHLHKALNQKKVEIFIDYQLEKGDEISPALIKAIEDSHVSIVILSENYASSKWCLEELSKIMECKKNQGQTVIPVFYNIDPSYVRKQIGSYEQAFAKHEGDHRCNKWKTVLTEVANLAGWDSRDRIESELLEDIVGDILRKLTSRYPNQLEGLVGIEDNYEQIESFLKIGSDDIRTLGIWGMGGIGKTTLAKVLYANLSCEFDVSCFLENVRENSSRHGGLEALHNKLFSKLLENENHCFDAPFLVSGFDMHRLGRKKVLIVLDDVDTIQQLEPLIKNCGFLRPGSRIVVTTRNKQIFHEHVEVFEVKELSFHHSLQLFCMTVFGEEQPKLGYEDLSRSIISYCRGNPLALKVLGASLRGRSKEAWESESRKLEEVPNTEMHNVLKFSYDGLDRSQKDIFLDIACFFKGEARDMVTSLLDACGFFAKSGIEVLLDKALITTSDNNKIEMHDLIQEMGREIVIQESIKDPGRRSRLWKPEEVHEVLKYNRGTDVVEGMILDLDTFTGNLCLTSDSFAKMTNLRFLKIYRSGNNKRFNVYFPNGLESLSYKLRYLHWDGFHLGCLPSNFCAELLVVLDMRNSKVKKLWDGVQNLVNLKKISLSGSHDLIEIPDLSKAKQLEIVYLEDCESLCQLPPSMSSLPKLTHLQLGGCKKIENLNVHSKSLQILYVDGCSSLKELSVTSEKIMELNLSGTSICALPSSIWQNTKLTYLWLHGCKIIDHYKCTQHNASQLSSLQALLHNIDHFPSLKMLNLSETNIESLPANIKNLSLLTWLNLDGCRKLVSLPELPPSLTALCLDNCRKLVSLPELLPPSLEEVRTYNCTSLETDFTQRLVVQHMLHSRIPLYHGTEDDCCDLFMFPGEHVTNNCEFCTTGSSITIPYIPLSSHLCGFIYCIILSKGTPKGELTCSVYQGDKLVGWEIRLTSNRNLISDHMFCSFAKMWQHDFSNHLTFKLEFYYRDMERYERHQESIKECGVFPVYASESEFKLFGSSGKDIFESESITQISYNESHLRGIGVEVGGSNIENEQDWEHLPLKKRWGTLP